MSKAIKMWAWYSPTLGLEIDFYETRGELLKNEPSFAIDTRPVRVEIRVVAPKKKVKK